jgi:membrane peptidoglycan carboxypeptidase
VTPVQRRIILARASRATNRNKPRIVLRLTLVAIVLLIVLALCVFSAMASALGVGVYKASDYYNKTVPPGIDRLVALENVPVGTTRFYDRTGKVLLAELYDASLGQNKPVSIDQISPWLQDATIAVEDPTFYSNLGFDPKGIARALYEDLRHQGALQGGSSITQQLVKNSVVGGNPTLQRKIDELLISIGVTQKFSGRAGKQRILEMYLNSIPYGNQCKGIEAAALFYFHEHAVALDLAQAALLAGIPRGPSLYDPVTALQNALDRQKYVLDRMRFYAMITLDQEQQAIDEAQHFTFHPRVYRRQWYVAPHWFYFVREHLIQDLPGGEPQLYSGLKVITTLDVNDYNEAQQLVKQQTSQLTAYGHNASDGAVVSIDPRTRQILCMVGSADFNDPTIAGQINMAVAPRQPGSSFKPFTYVTAFEQGHFPAEVILDAPVRYPDGNQYYEPHNYDERYHGAISLRFALANSFNVPAVKLLNMVGIDNMLQTVADVGMPQLLAQQQQTRRFGLSAVLGSGEVPLLQMTNAYAVFADGGIYAPYKYVLSVTDSDGQPVHLLNQEPPRRVIAPQYAYEITSILSDDYARSYEFGPQSVLTLGDRPAAVKTGTTNDFKDNLTIGYTPSLVTGVWVGNADDSQMYNVIGIDGAGPIWQQYMEHALGNSPYEQFVAPPGMSTALVSGYDGYLATNATSWKIRDVFAPGQVPHKFDYGYYNPSLYNIMGEMSLNGSLVPTAAELAGTGQTRSATSTTRVVGTGSPSTGTFHSATNSGNLCQGRYYHWTYDTGGGYQITCQ